MVPEHEEQRSPEAAGPGAAAPQPPESEPSPAGVPEDLPAEEPSAAESGAGTPPAEEPRSATPRAEGPGAGTPPDEEPRSATPRAEGPGADAPRTEEPRTEEPRTAAPAQERWVDALWSNEPAEEPWLDEPPAEHLAHWPEEDADGLDAEELDPDRPAAGTLSRRSRRTVLAAVAVVGAGLLTVGGIGAYNLFSAVFAHGTRSSVTDPVAQAPQPVGLPDVALARSTAAAFLADWSKGDLEGAGALTDRPDTATEHLTDFRTGLAFSSLALALQPPTGAAPTPADPSGGLPVPFTVTLTFPDAAAPWQYDGWLGVLRTGNGKAVVHWANTVLHPALGPQQSLSVQAVAAAPVQYTDRNGRPLDGFRSLAPLLAALRDGADTGAPGPAATDPSAANGRQVVIQDLGGGKAQQVHLISAPPGAPQQKLTIDADLQQAAEQAVDSAAAGGHPASLVAIEPSTGRVLAVANSHGDPSDPALTAVQAPGSTMKVVTAAALLAAGDTPSTGVACPDTTNSPRAWHNDFAGSFPDYTLTDDFAHSCNTAFIAESLAKLSPGTLGQVAKEQFGLGLTWSLAPGVHSADAKVPMPVDRDDFASSVIGQSTIEANALAMASVAATVQNGTFRQPVLLPGQQQVSAARPLTAQQADGLRGMMAATAARGTAQKPMAGIGGRVGAKTGTAENSTGTDNSWFTAYRDDLAVAVEVQQGGMGADAAGGVAAQVLKVGNG
ncbi:penicillin-binding transpeptidase domain-containing protein [Kitasatospora sp. NPDC058965]|uniref:penicillin-binding transpeptidase domain-containing protein n=1 Tax=Kitasatospora sp. NPDC058965 TaxID=3346682 RepID=UPI0036868E42